MRMYKSAVKEWINKFDSNSEIDLLTSIVNNEISIPEMVDSILCLEDGKTENAELFYNEMWRKQMYKSKRNVWWRRALREWEKNSDAYLIQFFLIFILGAWMYAIVVMGVK